MRRLLVAGAAVVCLVVEGAAPAVAATTHTTQTVTTQSATSETRSQPVSAASGARTVALGAQTVSEQTIAQQPERRRTYRKNRRGGFGRFLGGLAFLFIGLPMLLILALMIFFMLRRGRKQHERAMHDGRYDNGSYPNGGGAQNTPYPTQYQAGPHAGPNGTNQPGQNPDNRY